MGAFSRDNYVETRICFSIYLSHPEFEHKCFLEKNQRLHWNVLGIALGFSKNWRAIEVFINMETVNEH